MRWIGSAVCVVAALLAGCGGSDPVAETETFGLIAYETANNASRDIWVMNGDGTAPVLVVSDAGQPCLCGDGLAMAFIQGLNVFTIRADGTGQFDVTQRPPGTVGASLSEPAFNFAGDRIAYVVRPVVLNPVPWIVLIDADGSNETQLVTDGSQPAFSADGTRVVFMRGNDICIIDTDGTDFENLTNGAVGVTRKNPSFSPTGDQIVYASAPVIPSPTWSIRLLDVDTKNNTLVIDNGTAPNFNPDGDRIVFVREGRLLSTDLQGTNVAPLTAGPGESHPSWE